MRTIAVVNQKGGVGKTTVSINLASALAEAEHKTLLVDMDSQSHCAVGLAVPEEQIEQSIYDVMISHSKEEPMRLGEILWEVSEKLELAPASIDLSAFEQQMAGMPDRELCLKKVLDSIKNEYEFVVIDCPPAVGLLTFNALRAATDVIVPVETGYFSLHGLSKQLETLAILCQRCNQNVNVKVLASMYDIRTKMAREILGELRKHFGDKMFKTVVNFNTKLKEAASFGQPISEYDPASKGHKDFQDLVKEMLHGQPEQQRRQLVESLSEKLESISASADELLARAKPKVTPPDAGRIKSIEPPKQRTQQMEPVAVRTESKPAEAKAEVKAGCRQGQSQMPVGVPDCSPSSQRPPRDGCETCGILWRQPGQRRGGVCNPVSAGTVGPDCRRFQWLAALETADGKGRRKRRLAGVRETASRQIPLSISRGWPVAAGPV